MANSNLSGENISLIHQERKPLVVLPNKGRGEYSSCHKKSSTTKSSSPPQKELLCAMAFQELEWHAIDDVDFDFDDNQVDISEIAPKSGTPVIEDIQPIWSSD